MKKQILKTVAQTAAALLLLCVLWGVAYFSIGNELIVPSFFESVKAFGGLLQKSAFWVGLWGSMLRAFFAFALSFLFAGIFAFVAYLYPSLEKFFAPLVSAFRSMPVLAVLLILLTFLPAGVAPVAVGFLSLFPMLYTGILAALSGVDSQLVEVAKVCGTPLWRRIFTVYIPLSSPYIVREAGAGLSFSIKLIVSAEILSSTAKSLGFLMQDAKAYNVPELFALVLCSFLLGLLVELAFSALAFAVEKRVK